MKYDAILFDLLTGLLDSWTLWDRAAGGAEPGRRWRMEYLRVTFSQGSYRPYEDLVRQAAALQGINGNSTEVLFSGYGGLKPWPDVVPTLRQLANRAKLGIVTNCSRALGEQAVSCVGVPVDAVVIGETSGWYKPHPKAYWAALDALGVEPSRTLYVAGSPFDVAGASHVGMPVFWHNVEGMVARDGGAPVLMESRSMAPLLDLVD